MLEELEVLCGKHCNCYLVKDTMNKWEPFLLAHMSKNSHHSFNSGHQPNIVKGESCVYWMSSLFTLFIPLGTRGDLYQIITCLFLFYLPVSSICFLHNIFLVLSFWRRKETGRKRGENTSLLSCEGAYLHLCRRCSAKSHFYLVSKEIQVRFLSVSSAEGSTAAVVRKVKGCHSWQQEGRRQRQDVVWCWRCSAWPSVWFSSSEKNSN